MKPKHKRAFMRTAQAFAECSNATRLKVGAVVVKDNRIIGVGYNALPRHLEGPLEGLDGLTRVEVRHAEKSALMGLLREGVSPVGASMFITHSCCKPCAIDIVDAGIEKVYYQDEYRSNEGLKHLISCGVQVEKFDLEKE